MAVAEFLENVDLGALGLARPQPSLALTPILGRSSEAGVEGGAPGATVGAGGGGVLGGISPGLRGRVEQQVDAIAVPANKVLTGVMDTSFGMLKSLIPGQGGGVRSDQALPPGGFSLSSIAASIPQAIGSSRNPGGGENPEDGQQMVTVSKPSFVEEGSEGEGEEEDHVLDGEGKGEGEDDGSDNEDITPTQLDRGSVRSIKSFESMMNERSGKKTQKKVRLGKGVVSGVLRSGGGGQRKSLSDRLANMSALAGIKVGVVFFLVWHVLTWCVKGSPPASSRSSLRPATPQQGVPGLRIPPPVQRFLECSHDELRIGEVPDLLKEYRRLVEAVRVSESRSARM